MIKHCVVCGSPIARKPHERLSNYLKRVTCGNRTPCHKALCGKELKKARVKVSTPLPVKISLTPSLYATEADIEQARINIELCKRDAERRGVTIDRGRVYRGEELKQILGEITPIERIVEYG